MIEYYKDFAAYNHWANTQLLAAVDGLSVVPEALMNLFAHMVIAEKVWYLRMVGATENPPPIWPIMDIVKIREQIAENKNVFAAFLADIDDEGLQRPVHYKTSKGKPYSNSVGTILNQLAMHGSYHRGQINKMIREFGGTPAAVDYILFKR